jgi:hypothetical protein
MLILRTQMMNIKPQIENLINSHKAVIVCNGADSRDIVTAFAAALKESKSEVIVVTDEETETDASIMKVSKDFMSALLEYYYLYEFTDKIIIISDYCFCPNIKNYISSGILTADELVKSILYKVG